MKVLVTGGPGFVGQEVLRCLGARGAAIQLLVRNANSPPALDAAARFEAEIRVGDILDSVSLVAAAQGADTVVHLVGIISEFGRSTFENIHTAGTQNLLKAAQIVGVKRFIHMSALGVRPGARSRYHRTKWAAEEAVRQSGLEFTIFRPSLIYGPGDHFVNLFASMARVSPVVPVVGNPTSKFQPIAVAAVAQAFVGAAVSPEPAGREFDLCGHETFTLPEIVDEVLAAGGWRRLKLRIPEPLARLQAEFLEFVYPKLLGKAPPLNRDQLTMLEEDNTGDPGPADQVFSLKHDSFRAGIQRYLATPRSRKP